MPKQPVLNARVLVGLAIVVVVACGGETQPERPPPPSGIGTSGSEDVAPRPALEGAIELSLRRTNGTFVEVGELRGAPLLLFVFATFDAVSQMLLTPLRSILEHDPELQVLAVAVQPNARLLIDAYEHALEPPFIVTYDPNDVISSAESPLGPLAVPTLIVLDSDGVEAARYHGFADAEQIRALLAEAD